MKCAKCGYLGFETGDRCKNCGFDFSLLAEDKSDEPALDDVLQDEPGAEQGDPLGWLDNLDMRIAASLPGADTTPVDVQALLDSSALTRRDVPGGPATSPEPRHPTAVPNLRAPRPAPHAPPEPPRPRAVPHSPRTGEAAALRDRYGTVARPGEPTPGPYREEPDPGSDPGRTGSDERTIETPVDPLATRTAERAIETPVDPLTTPAATRRPAPVLPLFGGDDEPPAQLRSGPRAPLAVRRTPDAARVRAIAREVTQQPPRREEPTLQFADPSDTRTEAVAPASSPAASGRAPASAARRLLALAVDALLLTSGAMGVGYLTLRMLELPLTSWRVLPLAPMLSFLGLVAFAYVATFTAVGGQTIGKMAAGVRVVRTGGGPVGAATAVRRTVASLISIATLGLGFLPALLGRRRMAVHDRIAGTRVVNDY